MPHKDTEARRIESLYGGLVAASDKEPDATTLNVLVAEGDPPTEFKIFTTPTVDTSKGQFTFGPEEAAAVVAAFRTHGNEGMIDYDHASLGSSSDPALAGRAAGWFDIEMRADGLYATNVRWTPPAAEALKRREWRYMSPAFTTKGKRITSLINVALTNIPATKRLEPLMAASAVTEEKKMDLSMVLAALGLSADANEEMIKAKLAELSAAKRPAPAPAEPAFEALAREAHHEVNMQTEIATLREQQRVSTVREILRSTDRYTTPAFESHALTRTADEVRGMLLALPQKPSAVYSPRGGRDSAVELSPADRRLCALLGTDEKAVLAHKAELVERDRNRQRRGILIGEEV